MDAKFILHASAILKESSSKVVIHSSPGHTDILLFTLAHLYEYKKKKRIHIPDCYGQYKKNLRLSNIIFEDENINSLIAFHAFSGSYHISSFYSSVYKKGKAAYFKTLQGTLKFQSTFATLRNDWNISDELLTKLQEFVCNIYFMGKKI